MFTGKVGENSSSENIAVEVVVVLIERAIIVKRKCATGESRIGMISMETEKPLAPLLINIFRFLCFRMPFTTHKELWLHSFLFIAAL